MKRLFIQELLNWKNANQRNPLIIKGIRQVGKTYTITEFGNEHFAKLHYINFEKDGQIAKIFNNDLDPQRIINEISFALNNSINLDADLLFFDEIQACPRALTSLKYFQEELPQLAICAAGSLLGVHLTPDSFPVGKVDIKKMHPMSFEEFLLALDDQKSVDFLNDITQSSQIPEVIHNHLWQQMKYYFIVGGLPEVVKIFSENKADLYTALELAREKQNTLIISYNADMAKHSGKTNAMHIERLWRAVPAQLAREQDGATKKFAFKDIIPGINRYSRLVNVIDWLEAAGLIIKSHIVNSGNLPFAAYTKENTFKLYLTDVGLLGALSQLPIKTILDYDYGTYKGFFAENFVGQEFSCHGVDNLYCWQEGSAEVEFLREIDGNVIPVEVKSGWITRAKSLKIFTEKYHPPYTVTFSGKNLLLSDKQHFYPLYLVGKFPF